MKDTDPNSNSKTQQDHKTSKEVFSDFILEIIGYEKGIYRTIVDLIKQPRVVVESYLSRTNMYVSPFKILISIIGVWLFFNNFIIDWYKLLSSVQDTVTKFSLKSEVIPANLLFRNSLRAKILGDLLSKYYMAFVILGTPLWAYICFKLCKPYKIDFRTHLAVVGYHSSLGFIPAFIFIVCIAINVWLCLAVALIIMLSPFLGLRVIYNKILAIVPVSSFFEKDGLAIEKNYYRAKWLMTFSFFLIYGLLCWIYYSLYPFNG